MLSGVFPKRRRSAAMRGLSGDAWRADRAVPSGFVLSRSFPDLVGDFFLVFAFLGQLVITYRGPDDLLALANDDGLPGGRRPGRLGRKWARDPLINTADAIRD